MTDDTERIRALGQTERDVRLQSQIELLRKLTEELGAARQPTTLAGRIVSRVLPRFARPAVPATEVERTAEELRRLAQALIMSSSR
jgi:hypothetical protein